MWRGVESHPPSGLTECRRDERSHTSLPVRAPNVNGGELVVWIPEGFEQRVSRLETEFDRGRTREQERECVGVGE